MEVKVLKTHPYRGKRRAVGSIYECPAKFARLLIAIKKAEEYIEPEPEPEPKPKPEPEKKPTPTRRKVTRKKATRKKTASKKTTSRRGSYQTRDMKAEE